MVALTAKLLFGTTLYILVLWEARRNPRAAGMMLTFPALNGISMLLTEAADLDNVVGVMLLMPTVNGLMCAIYISAFKRIVSARLSPTWTSGLLLTAIAIIWIGSACLITRNSLRVPGNITVIYALIVFLGGFLATLIFPAQRPVAPSTTSPETLTHLLHRNWFRIILFCIALSSVLVADRTQHSPAILGVLAALPLVPFFGLHSIACDNTLSYAARREEIAFMANGVWLGPGIATAFIVGFWTWLELLATHIEDALKLVGSLSLLMGWSMCAIVIWGCEKLLRQIQSN